MLNCFCMSGGPILKSRAGHLYIPPKLEDVKVFRVDGAQMVNLHVGTWHQGPFFASPEMDFYNLELSDTGVSWVLIDILSVLPFLKETCFGFRKLITPHMTFQEPKCI